MRCAEYEQLIGKMLLHNVVNNAGMLLIPENTILTEGHIEKLENFKIDLYDIQVEAVKEQEQEEQKEQVERSGQKIQAVAVENAVTRKAVLEAVRDTGEMVRRVNADLCKIEEAVLSTGKIPLAEVEQNVLPTIMQASQNRNVYKLFADLKAEENSRFKHSIGVACMASLLGRWLGMSEEDIALLTTAASLCDIGLIKLPSPLLHKTTELLPHEHEIFKQHTVFGYELLKESDVDHRIALVALQHHEREDGSGYPARLQSAQIQRFSKIVALADVYLTMVSESPQRQALPIYQVIHNLHADIVQKRFDSAIGMTFLNRLMAAQVGTNVLLTDGRKGKIVLIHPNYPTRPLVSLEQGFIDLSKTSAVQMKEIIG